MKKIPSTIDAIIEKAVRDAAREWDVTHEAVKYAWFCLRRDNFRYAKVEKILLYAGIVVSRRQLKYFSRKVNLMIDLKGQRPKNFGALLRRLT